VCTSWFFALRKPPHAFAFRLAVEQTNAIEDLLGYVNDERKTQYDQNSISARCTEKWGLVNDSSSPPVKETDGLTLFAPTDPSVFAEQMETNSGW
jgi:hypothetical protein